MTTYVYKSTTGKTVNIDSFTITTNPGLELKYANDILDSYIGINLARYDDGVLVTADDSTPVNAKLNPLTEVVDIPVIAAMAGDFERRQSAYFAPWKLATFGDSRVNTSSASPADGAGYQMQVFVSSQVVGIPIRCRVYNPQIYTI